MTQPTSLAAELVRPLLVVTGAVSARSLRQARRSTHPFFWGAFVAAGDWR